MLIQTGTAGIDGVLSRVKGYAVKGAKYAGGKGLAYARRRIIGKGGAGAPAPAATKKPFPIVPVAIGGALLVGGALLMGRRRAAPTHANRRRRRR